VSGYTVNASLTMLAWVWIDADSPDEALQIARSLPPSDFDYDPGSGSVEFNVEPEVEDG